MKNKKIHKILTFAVILTVLLSVACVSASAYVYEGKNGEYYVPDKLYKEEMVGEDFKFLLDNTAPVKQDHWLSYFTAGSHVSQTFTGTDMLLYNSSDDVQSEVPLSDHWLSYVVGLDLEYSPLAIEFSVIASINSDDVPDIDMMLIFQNKDQYGTSEYNSDDSVTVFNLSDLHSMGYDFVATTDSEGRSVFVVDVELLIDPFSKKSFIRLFDQNNDVITLTEYVHTECFLGFKILAGESANWDYIGFESNSNNFGYYEGFSAYYYLPADNGDVAPNPDHVIKLDGSSYEGMTPNVTNYSNGFSTDYNGYPVMENGYYKLTTNSSSSSQAQLWFPSQEYGISGFSSEKHSYGELSFDISAAVRDYVEFKFVEGIEGERWGPEWCLQDSFLKIVPTDFSFDTYFAVFDILDINGNVLTQYNVDANDPYAEWINVKVNIILDPETDSIILDYYINGRYTGSCSTELTTANNSITSIYCSLRTEIPGSGMLLDNFIFSYSNDMDYQSAYIDYLTEYLKKISEGEIRYFYDDYLHARNDYDQLFDFTNDIRAENEHLKKINIQLGADLQGQKGTDVIDKVFSGTWQGISSMVNDIFDLGINLDGNTANGNEITIGLLAVIVIVCFVIVKILPLLIGAFKA